MLASKSILCLLWLTLAIEVSVLECNIVREPPESTNKIAISSSKDVAPSKKSLMNSAQVTTSPVDSSSGEDSSPDLESFWLNQRDLFFNLTTFNLTKVSLLLLCV